MASFAKLDGNNVVLNIVKIGNDVPTSNGPLGENDMHIDGETYCQTLFKGGNWKQCSFSNLFRKQMAGIGSTYDPVKNIFISPQPYDSWTLDLNNNWQPPIERPSLESGAISAESQLSPAQWNETEYRYDAVELWTGNSEPYYWDPSTSTWIAL
tara:strand:- start:854 stop:1315 length:462 start_codon:yes stop_codon:yes gene_type:complete